jgi:hypothetical protein
MNKKIIDGQLGRQLRSKSWDNLAKKLGKRLVDEGGQKASEGLETELRNKLGHKLWRKLKEEIKRELNEE